MFTRGQIYGDRAVIILHGPLATEVQKTEGSTSKVERYTSSKQSSVEIRSITTNGITAPSCSSCENWSKYICNIK
jgi:hypothetical protein